MTWSLAVGTVEETRVIEILCYAGLLFIYLKIKRYIRLHINSGQEYRLLTMANVYRRFFLFSITNCLGLPVNGTSPTIQDEIKALKGLVLSFHGRLSW